jgi:hypothetical protein
MTHRNAAMCVWELDHLERASVGLMPLRLDDPSSQRRLLGHLLSVAALALLALLAQARSTARGGGNLFAPTEAESTTEAPILRRTFP